MNAKVQLASVTATSKGFFGEYGHHCGYFEFTNINDGMIHHFHKVMSLRIPTNSAGQLLLSVRANSPTGLECEKRWPDEGWLLSMRNDLRKLNCLFARLMIDGNPTQSVRGPTNR
jgi:hypothetical protein